MLFTIFTIQSQWMRLCTVEMNHAKGWTEPPAPARTSAPRCFPTAAGSPKNELIVVDVSLVQETYCKYIYDPCIVVAGIGPIENLTDCNIH